MKRIEQATTDVLERVHLVSIKSKIIVFAVIATLIPAFTMGWISYRNNRQVLEENLQVGLSGLTSHASRELRLWVEERQNETRVLAGSYEVSENVEKLLRADGAVNTRESAENRLRDYLGRVGGKFPDYTSLVVVDLDGTPLAASHDLAVAPTFSEAVLPRLRDGEAWIQGPSTQAEGGTLQVTLMEPIRSLEGLPIGAMASRLDLRGVDELLAGGTKRNKDAVLAISAEGFVLASSSGVGSRSTAKFSKRALTSVLESAGEVSGYRNLLDAKVVGMARHVKGVDWWIVAERDFDAAYGGVHRLRDQTLTVIVTVALFVGLLAYVLGVTIVRPLDRLIAGARRVAQGDFDVDLPVEGRNEISYLSSVFNRMVTSLRATKERTVATHDALRERNTELMEEALTDSLTGLFNRKAFDDILKREIAAARRHARSASILMLDVDHFKAFNDAHGHVAGDAALCAVADRIRDTVRGCDYAMRYGGEEFLVLTENDVEGAETLAERLRAEVAAIELEDGQKITISVGVATFSDHAADGDELLAKADAALYASKRAGRDCVTLSGAEEEVLEPA